MPSAQTRILPGFGTFCHAFNEYAASSVINNGIFNSCWNEKNRVEIHCANKSRDLTIFVQHDTWVVISAHISHWWPCIQSCFMFLHFPFTCYDDALWCDSSVLMSHTSASTGNRDAIQVHLLAAIPVHHATYASLRSSVMLMWVCKILCGTGCYGNLMSIWWFIEAPF